MNAIMKLVPIVLNFVTKKQEVNAKTGSAAAAIGTTVAIILGSFGVELPAEATAAIGSVIAVTLLGVGK